MRGADHHCAHKKQCQAGLSLQCIYTWESQRLMCPAAYPVLRAQDAVSILQVLCGPLQLAHVQGLSHSSRHQLVQPASTGHVRVVLFSPLKGRCAASSQDCADGL